MIPDACEKLWAAVLKRAYFDAIGKVTDINYSSGGGQYSSHPEWEETRKRNIFLQKRRFQLEALDFCKNCDWIYMATGVSKSFVLKKIKENYKPICN